MMPMSPSIQSLKISISNSDQSFILDKALRLGSPAEVEGDLMEPFWVGYGVRSFDCAQQNNRLPAQYYGRYSYLMRGQTALSWHWQDQDIKEIIERTIEPIKNCILNLNRVVIIIQIPGKAVPAHRDLFIGNQYSNLESAFTTFRGSQTLTYLGDPWLQQYYDIVENDDHTRQSYFGLRIPITSKSNSNGKPFIENQAHERYLYDTNKHLFLLNEATHDHGAEPVDFYRGVVIVDAKLKITELEEHFLF